MVSFGTGKIIYTFKYGGYLNKKQAIAFSSIGISLIVMGLTTFILCLVFNKQGAWGSWILTAIGLVFLITMLILLCISKKHNKEILMWLNDENLFETQALPWEFSKKYMMGSVFFRFGVDFIFNGEPYRRMSSGYDAFYKSVKETSITVLYSPKYDQVMILRN